MIVVDIETTGVDPQKHQMVSIGAVDYDTGETFYGECRIYKFDEWTQEALNINGFTLEQIHDEKKQTPFELYERFVKWASPRSSMLAGHNIGGFDLQFLKQAQCRGRKNTTFPFRYQTVDLHSVAFSRFKKSYSMSKICQMLGIKPEPEIHNALTGAQKEYECFKILLAE
jgi:DNA polymerase III epsilon subunit-like protein